MKIISGSSHPLLCEDICNYLSKEVGIKTSPVKTFLSSFNDGETRVEIQENIRNQDVYIIQSLSKPVNDNLMELIIILDALKRSDVKSITVIIPYYGYSRQDKKCHSRSPISARVVADILELNNIKRIVTLDLHSPQIQGFFNIPVDNLFSSIIFLPYIKTFTNGITCVSPDSGGLERVTHFAKKLDCSMSFCYKHRTSPGEIGSMRLIGNVEGKDCLLIDDLCDSGGTLVKSADILKENGAISVNAFFTHPVLSNNAIEKLTNSRIDNIYTTDSIPPSKNLLENNKFHIVSIAPMIGDAIKRLVEGNSLSEMFD